MASGTSKEEKKRKRAAEAQEGATESTRKVKRERKSNGFEPTVTDRDATPSKSKSKKTSVKSEVGQAQEEAERTKEEKQKKSKNKDKSSRKSADDAAAIATNGTPALSQRQQSTTALKIQPSSRSSMFKSSRKQRRANKDLWTSSEAVGGRFLDHDPIFSADEKYAMLATTSGVQIFDTETSLLEQSVQVHDTTCYALSPSSPRHVYISNRHADIHKFDWTNASQKATSKSSKGTSIRSIAVVSQDDEADLVFSIQKSGQPKSTTSEQNQADWKPQQAGDCLVVQKASGLKIDEESCVLFQASGKLKYLRVVDGGRLVILAGDNEMIIGSLPDRVNVPEASLEQLKSKYRWRSLNAVHAITCLDARVGSSKSYAVALGNAKGEVLIYDNVLESLDRLENDGSDKPPKARVLKWHREAPNTVRWSKDGNYLISGGNETVLCLWQLETGQRQTLPHLTAAIRNLTVSPSGTSYGVHLADNSFIVLSTAELQPTTYIAGPQALCIADRGQTLGQGMWKAVRHLYALVLAVNNPRDPKSLLLAVPTEQQADHRTKLSPPSPFLQTYNLEAGRHTSRQALTRNLATETNIDPDRNKIDIPNITHMQISHDGQWLATVEDWLPPARDVQHLATDKNDVLTERKKRRETYIKIWRFDEASKSWSLNTRIARPHADIRDESANRTFHLVAHPTKTRFATIGEDNSIRIWRPRTTRGEETSWFAKSIVKLGRSAVIGEESMDFLLPASPTIGRLAYSNDGSVLAVCQQADSQTRSTVVHLLDGETGEVRGSETGLVVGNLIALGFLDRYLVLLSSELRVWDVVIGTMVFSKSLGQQGAISPPVQLATSHLAISVLSGTFAVAGLGFGDEKEGTVVSVFKPSSAEPIFTKKLGKGVVSALTPLAEGNGYVVLDSRAEIRKITTSVVRTSKVVAKELAAKTAKQADALEVIGQDDEMDDANTEAERAPRAVAALEDAPSLASSKLLADVFASGSGGIGMANVKDTFSNFTNSLFPVLAK